MGTALQALEVARSQIGIKESPAGSNGASLNGSGTGADLRARASCAVQGAHIITMVRAHDVTDGSG
jgi:hypothetical protein